MDGRTDGWITVWEVGTEVEDDNDDDATSLIYYVRLPSENHAIIYREGYTHALNCGQCTKYFVQ